MPARLVKHIVLPLVWLAVWAGSATSAQDLELSQAVDCALRQNRDLKLLAYSLESQKLAVSDAASEFQFAVHPKGDALVAAGQHTAGAGLAVTRKAEAGTSAEVGGTAISRTFDEQPDVRRNILYVEIQQPLLRRAGPLVNREPLTAAESKLTAVRREIELQRTDLVVQVVEAHENLVRLQRQLEQERQTLQRLERFVRLTKARERQGRATRVDVLRDEMKRTNAEVRLGATDERLRSLQAEYADLLGLPPAIGIRAAESPRLAVDLPDYERAVTTALSNRLDYAQILQDHQDARRGVAVARRNLWPDLKMIARYEQVGEGTQGAEASRMDDNVWFVGMGLASDFPRTREKNALAESIIRREFLELKVENVRAAVARQVQQSLLAYARSQQEIPLDERSYEAARSRLRLARRLFDMGKGDSFSVSNAEDEFQEAEGRWLAAQADASVAACRLLRVLGALIEYPAELKATAMP